MAFASQIHLPDCQRDTDTWLSYTDELTQIRFNPAIPVELDFFPRLPESFFTTNTLTQGSLRETQLSRRLDATAAIMISRTALGLFEEENFEKKWLALDYSTQEGMILQSFRMLDTIHDGSRRSDSFLGPEKLHCPELCRDALLRDGGKGVLDLMRFYILETDELPRHLTFLENKRFLQLIRFREDEPNVFRKEWHYSRRLIRNRYIRKFIMCFMACHMDEEVFFARYTATGNRERRTDVPVAAPTKKDRLGCDLCGRDERKAESGKMPLCVRCNQIGREIRYCNKQCQREAWPRHKRFCGKDLDMSVLTEEIPPRTHNRRPRSRPDLPLIANGRRPGMFHQMNLLNAFPMTDYYIIKTTLDEDRVTEIAVMIDDLVLAAAFVVMRNRCMRRADEPALFFVYRVLQTYAIDPVTARSLGTQMEREHGAHFSRLLEVLERDQPPAVAAIPAADICQALVWLKGAGRFEHQLADYKRDVSSETRRVEATVGPLKDLTIALDFPGSLLSTAQAGTI